MLNRKQRAQVAHETLQILEQESYTVDGEVVSLSDFLVAMRAGTTLYTPSVLEALVGTLEPTNYSNLTIRVLNCTTFAAAKLLIKTGYLHPLCLNFASAKNPGGGFLSGSQAQEEYLARGSGLYASLTREMAYYEANRSFPSSLYTNHLIYSPQVPVFRDEDGSLLPEPYPVGIVTSPAVNASAVRKNQPALIAQIQPTMEIRIRSVLAVTHHHHQHRALVLGAWGCGVFGNEPTEIAHWFYDALYSDLRFRGAFEQIVFAVLDFAEGAPTFQAFQHVFGGKYTE